jgi:hypothetical protein
MILVMLPMLMNAKVKAGRIRCANESENITQLPVINVSRIGMPVMGGLRPAE